MYDICFDNSKAKRKYNKLGRRLSAKVKKKLIDTLQNNPYPLSTSGSTLSKPEHKGPFICYEITGGERILYNVTKQKQQHAVLIFFVGNDDEEIRYLKGHSKKK